jgi:type II secretory pathway component PulF
MHAQLHAGIPPGQCLVLIENTSMASWRPMLREMAHETQGGGMLSNAMARYPLIFPEWEISVVRAGEIGGTLPEAMADIAESLETEVELRLQVHARTFHLRITAFVLALVACIVFRARDVLPVLLRTGQTISSAKDFFHYFYPAFQTFAFIVLGYLLLLILWRLVSRTRNGRSITQAIVRRTPLIGPIMAGILRLRFISVLGTLWHAGVAPIEAIQTAARGWQANRG